jgi:exodeoxyribonuclease VII small subunit
LADEARSGARPDADRPEIGYEAARTELSDVVRRLEAGGQTLEESLALWQRGEELADICERWLSGATARLNAVIAAHEQGPGSAQPAESAAADRSSQT